MLNKHKGFTLIELMIVVCIIGTLTGIAVPTVINLLGIAQKINIISELKMIENEILSYEVEMGAFPTTLAEIGLDTLKDPWG